ncbi:MAG: mshA 5 [Acidobacteria bacterium]|nr:mshA 5 [Acidobacteriota bacterium]
MRIGIDARKLADFGIGSYIRGLLSALVELGGDAQYVVFAPAPARSLVPKGVEHVVFDAPNYSVRELVALGRAAGRARLDLFHAPHYVVPFTRIPVVVTIHDLIHLHVRHRNPLAPLYARTMLTRAVRNSRRILTVSEAVKRDLVTELGVAAEKIAVTPNGIDAIFTPDGPRPRRPPYFLYAGTDKPHKNVGTLVDAFAAVRRERSGLQLVLAGAPFERFANRDGVVRAGFVSREELASLVRGALALVMPSSEEGFGLPAAEAMASGTAVIASANAALTEVTGDAALHVDAGDAHALAAAMLRVADDDALRTALGSLGIARARAFTWKRCAELTLAAYRHAL